MLWVTTDYAIPTEISQLEVTVSGPSMEIQTSSAALSGPGDLPGTLGLAHEGGPLGPFDLTVDGTGAGAVVVATRRARFMFRPGETLVLEIHLSRACEGVRCAGDDTCDDGMCRPVDLASTELTSWPPQSDAGSDSATDAQVDAPDSGPVDAGDGAPPDAGRPDGAPPDAPMPDTAVGSACDDLFGARTDYFLCAERAGECEFYVDPTATLSCEGVCMLSGATCVGSYAETSDFGAGRCRRAAMQTCSVTGDDFICICTLP